MRAWPSGIAAVALALAGSLACSTPPGGPELLDLGIFATREGGIEQRALCVTLPALLGSHVERSASPDGAFDLAVDATRDGASVRLGRATADVPFPLSIGAAELRGDYETEITVDTSSALYTLRLSSGCGMASGSSSGGAAGQL